MAFDVVRQTPGIFLGEKQAAEHRLTLAHDATEKFGSWFVEENGGILVLWRPVRYVGISSQLMREVDRTPRRPDEALQWIAGLGLAAAQDGQQSVGPRGGKTLPYAMREPLHAWRAPRGPHVYYHNPPLHGLELLLC